MYGRSGHPQGSLLHFVNDHQESLKTFQCHMCIRAAVCPPDCNDHDQSRYTVETAIGTRQSGRALQRRPWSAPRQALLKIPRGCVTRCMPEEFARTHRTQALQKILPSPYCLAPCVQGPALHCGVWLGCSRDNSQPCCQSTDKAHVARQRILKQWQAVHRSMTRTGSSVVVLAATAAGPGDTGRRALKLEPTARQSTRQCCEAMLFDSCTILSQSLHR